MAGRLIGAWNPALSDTGAPISGAKLYTYQAGTTTSLTTYPTSADADSALNANTNPVVADAAGRFTELWAAEGTTYDLKWTDAAGAQIKLFEDVSPLAPPASGTVQRGHLAGLGMSTAGASANLTVAAGEAADATHTVLLSLAANTVKTTGSWAAGTIQGGLDTGAVANSTGYHWYLIGDPTSGAVDVAFSTSASAPTTGDHIPSSYSLYRRIGWAKTNGSGQWLTFKQYGDRFEWVAPVRDVTTSTPTSGATNTIALTTPSGVNVVAMVTATANYVSGAVSELRVFPTTGSSPGLAQVYTQNGLASSETEVSTDTSRQIKTVFTYGGATSYDLMTTGWIDRRGRDD